MPDVLVDVRGDWLKERKAEFINAIEDGIVAALQMPKNDKIVRLIEHAPENFSSPHWASERFTHIEITMFKGRSMDAKRALYRIIVESLVSFEMPKADVKIILIEVLPSDVGMQGGIAACDLKLGYNIAI